MKQRWQYLSCHVWACIFYFCRIQLCGNRLVSASYDCTVVVSTLPSCFVQEMATSSSSNKPLKCVTEEEVKQVSTVQVDNEIGDTFVAKSD